MPLFPLQSVAHDLHCKRVWDNFDIAYFYFLHPNFLYNRIYSLNYQLTLNNDITDEDFCEEDNTTC